MARHLASSDRRRSRWLAAHAVVVGMAWFPVLLALGLSPWFRDLGRLLPEWLLGGTVLVGIAFTVPLSWPVLLAIGWFEGHLAERVATGDPSARRVAGVVLRLQALAAFLLAAIAAAAVVGKHGWWAQERVRWAWAVPAMVAAAHLILARRVAAGDERSPPVGDASPT